MGEVIDQRARLGELGSHVVDRGRVGEQQAVALEEGARAGLAHRAEALRLLAQGIGQFVGGGIGQLLGRGLHHGQDHFVALRKRIADGRVVLRPRLVGLQQAADIGIDGEIARHVDAAGDGEQQRNADHGPGADGGKLDDTGQRGSDHLRGVLAPGPAGARGGGSPEYSRWRRLSRTRRGPAAPRSAIYCPDWPCGRLSLHRRLMNRQFPTAIIAPAIAPVTVAIAAVAMIGTAHAQTSPDKLVQTAVEGVIAKIKADPETRSGDLAKITAVVQREFLPYTDFGRTTRLALGNAWKQATPEQQKTLQEQFTALLVRSYAVSLSQLRDQSPKFTYKPAKAGSSANDSVVATRVLNNGDEMLIDYRLQRGNDGWKIYDINMMGAWLIEVYRKQFADIVARDGVDGLIKYLTNHNARAAA
ncbi:putative phospholipid-binding protein MlaC precursor [compost metagenome]